MSDVCFVSRSRTADFDKYNFITDILFPILNKIVFFSNFWVCLKDQYSLKWSNFKNTNSGLFFLVASPFCLGKSWPIFVDRLRSTRVDSAYRWSRTAASSQSATSWRPSASEPPPSWWEACSRERPKLRENTFFRMAFGKQFFKLH